MLPSTRLWATAAAVIFGLAGCRDHSVAHYRISKETAFAGVPSAAAAAPHAPTSEVELAWQAPPHWRSQPVSAPRRGAYSIGTEGGGRAEMVVTVFPGDVGGEVANINRWRSQVQLEPLPAEAVAASVQRWRVGDLEVALVDFTGGTGPAPVRVLGAIVPFGTSTWFFKATGHPGTIEHEQPAFRALLQTLHSTQQDHACCDS